jgi:WD40 repeat protein
MPPSSKTRVFLSYAHRDGTELAQRLHADLAKNFATWLDTKRLTAGEVWSGKIEQAIDQSDILVALLSEGSFISDICRAEQVWALDEGKCVIPVHVQRECRVPIHLKARQYLDFSNPAFYSEHLPNLIAAIKKKEGVVISPELLGRYNNTPALPQNFVPRPEILERFRNTLFAEAANRTIAVTALQGMGGIGKTVLAQALCHDEAVRRAYPDGIFWFSIGKERLVDFATRLKEVPGLHRLLGQCDGDAAFASEYLDVMRKKAALVVLDDVWHASDVQPFIAESPRSRLLITTRDTSISAWFGAHEFTANLLTEAESRQVLAKWCGRTVADLPRQASEVIDECGYLPLALAMIGAQLRSKRELFWSSVLDDLRHADLQKIKAQFPEPHTTLFRAIQSSVDALEETARQRYLQLAVLLEDMAAPPQVQQCIWGVAETEAAETAEQFIGLSLAQRDQPEGSIRLHDLQLDYVRGHFPDKEALELIHGAVRLSSNVIEKDRDLFASQMVGRLLLHGDQPPIKAFTKRVAVGAQPPWLEPLHPALEPPGGALICTLSGHSRWVWGVALTHDGKCAVSASGDLTLKLWDLASGRELRTFFGHSDSVNAVAVSPDGQRAVSASSDQTLKIWDLSSGRELRTLTGHSDSVNAVAVSPDGQRAVSASSDNTVKVWDLSNGRELRTLTRHTDQVYGLALTPNGQKVISASADKTLRVWELATGRELNILSGHAEAAVGVAVTRDGGRAVSASADNTLKVWDLESGRELRTLIGHTDPVLKVALTSDGQRAVSASADKTSKVWELDTGRELLNLFGHTSDVTAVAVTPDGQFAVTASEDSLLKVWELSSARSRLTLPGHSRAVLAVAITPDEQMVVSASHDKTLKLWDLSSGRELRTLTGHSDSVNAVAVSPDGRQAISASADRTLKVWDSASGRELYTLSGHSHWVNAVAVTPDGRWAVSASADQTLKVWDLSSGCELRSLVGHSWDVNEVALTPDGQRAVSASHDKTLKLWDLARGRELHTLSGHSGWVNVVAVTPDGQRAVSASSDKTLKVWDLVSGRELRTLTGHTGGIWAVAVTPDGRSAVSTSRDHTLIVWDLESGSELRSLIGHTDLVGAVVVTPVGQRAVSASLDRTLKVWDLETGKCLATFTCDSVPTCCGYSNALKLIVAGDADGHLHFLRLEEPKRKP